MRQRKKLRNQFHNYSSPGFYFVTICSFDKLYFFGDVIDEQMVFSEIGKIANACFQEIPKHFSGVEVLDFIVMPNHIHAIIEIKDLFESYSEKNIMQSGSMIEIEPPQYQKLPVVIGSFKSAVSKIVNRMQKEVFFSWQRSFHDEILKFEKTKIAKIRQYIINNPKIWDRDRNNLKNR